MPSKLVTKILANDYIDFAELPPAKGRGRPVPQSLDGQIIVVQAADLLQARKLIPDLATWLQCFSIYVATIATKFPGRIPELMAYQTTIAKASMKYKWPSWVVYDQNFRQEAAGNPTQSWAKVDPSIYAVFHRPSSDIGKLVYQVPEFESLLRQLSHLSPEEKTLEVGTWSRLLSAVRKGWAGPRNLLQVLQI